MSIIATHIFPKKSASFLIIFDQEIYEQPDGLAVGFKLDRLLVKVFMTILERGQLKKTITEFVCDLSCINDVFSVFRSGV